MAFVEEALVEADINRPDDGRRRADMAEGDRIGGAGLGASEQQRYAEGEAQTASPEFFRHPPFAPEDRMSLSSVAAKATSRVKGPRRE